MFKKAKTFLKILLSPSSDGKGRGKMTVVGEF
jgi:hypothetical protein